uniref:Uncharacterized protein n=1 Tax=Sphaerodactylus townsendi TaxID=933632 RepID=A0ACB8EB10_9SAUR
MSEQNSTQDGDGEAQPSLSMPFLLVLVFFGMGLVGFLICHVLKKKGYRCRTFRDEFDSDNKEPLAELQNEEDEEMNEDTVEKIVKCIIQSEANVEVLKEMLGKATLSWQCPATPIPSLCPHRNSQDGGVPHHHTVHLGSTQAPCIHCSRKKRHTLHRQSRSKEGKSKMHPGETTVFSVGRFHVTHIEKKPASHGSKEKSLPDSSQDLGSGDLDRETREESQNGLVPMDHLQHGRFQEAAGAQSDREPKDACKDESATGESLLNVTTNLDVPKNGLERIKRSKTGSLQEVDLLGAELNGVRPRSICVTLQLLQVKAVPSREVRWESPPGSPERNRWSRRRQHKSTAWLTRAAGRLASPRWRVDASLREKKTPCREPHPLSLPQQDWNTQLPHTAWPRLTSARHRVLGRVWNEAPEQLHSRASKRSHKRKQLDVWVPLASEDPRMATNGKRNGFPRELCAVNHGQATGGLPGPSVVVVAEPEPEGKKERQN